MKAFWINGGLHVQPESEHEGRLLVDLLSCLRFEQPPEMQVCTGSGQSESGNEGLLRLLGADYQVAPPSLARKHAHKQAVIVINERK